MPAMFWLRPPGRATVPAGHTGVAPIPLVIKHAFDLLPIHSPPDIGASWHVNGQTTRGVAAVRVGVMEIDIAITAKNIFTYL